MQKIKAALIGLFMAFSTSVFAEEASSFKQAIAGFSESVDGFFNDYTGWFVGLIFKSVPGW